jgi:hypothetical protein
MVNISVHHSRANEPIGEIGTILATGFLRLLERKSSHLLHRNEENPLDCRTLSNGHVRKKRKDVTP